MSDGCYMPGRGGETAVYLRLEVDDNIPSGLRWRVLDCASTPEFRMGPSRETEIQPLLTLMNIISIYGRCTLKVLHSKYLLNLPKTHPVAGAERPGGKLSASSPSSASPGSRGDPPISGCSGFCRCDPLGSRVSACEGLVSPRRSSGLHMGGQRR